MLSWACLCRPAPSSVQNVVSIGALAIAPSDENVVWVGTGDASCARSAYWGDGVYKSTDGAKTWRREGALGNYRLYGDRLAVTQNEPNGLTFAYYLKEQAKDKVTFTVADAAGKTIRTLDGTAKAGINRIVWDMSDSNRPPGAGFRSFGGEIRTVATGEYLVTLRMGGKQYTQKARILAASGAEP